MSQRRTEQATSRVCSVLLQQVTAYGAKPTEYLKTIERNGTVCFNALEGCEEMKLNVCIDKTAEERVEIYAHERNELVEQIETLVNSYAVNLNGYTETEIVP